MAISIQRFDSALALNVHFHALVLDGPYSLDAAGKPQFHAVAAPDDEGVGEVAMRVYTRVAKLFDGDPDAIGVREPAMAAMATASLRRMVATGSRRGLPIRRLKTGQTPVASLLGKTCAEVEGFNIHANVRVAAAEARLVRFHNAFVAISGGPDREIDTTFPPPSQPYDAVSRCACVCFGLAGGDRSSAASRRRCEGQTATAQRKMLSANPVGSVVDDLACPSDRDRKRPRSVLLPTVS